MKQFFTLVFICALYYFVKLTGDDESEKAIKKFIKQ